MGDILDFRDPAAIATQAREWLIRLDGDAPLSEDEVKALREWSGRSSAHRAELKRLSKFWNSANVLTQLSVPLQRPRRKLDLSGWWSDSSAPTRVAAKLAIACIPIALATWWWMPHIARNGVYATSIGQQQTLSLADGSFVQINTDSQVQVDYSDHFRKIWLLRGEAFFTVAPNAQKPFEVFAAGGVVRAVGTTFAVHLQGSNMDVTVTNGQVNVMPDIPSGEAASTEVHALTSRLVSLKAGQAATFSAIRFNAPVAADKQQLTEPELKRRLSWHEGYLVFSGQQLDAVIAEVNRYSPVALELADASLATVSIGGRFKVGDLDAVCDVLQSNFGIQSVRIDDRHIQLRAAPAR